MKSFILGLALFLNIFSAQALTITDVGGLDNLEGRAELGNSGFATEEAWIADVLSLDPSLVSLNKIEYNDNADQFWTQTTDDSEVWYQEVDELVSFFMIKTGKSGSYDDTHFLFSNVGNLEYAVFDQIQLGFEGKGDIEFISHVMVGASFENVPEPSILTLMGLGLFGLGFARRRKQQL